ncbi:MAG TPA: acylphosphatase [Bradyrhizobium sp.]|uniref:acylphosphatase n=1 Tax=Bradyrhizobium sp. TaxID=376 RepID=UPI002D805E2A|nr:acylphosphatase [Bradyrhizobium sp.]HET7888608.1 acylphosphatase [Bradyrhizobium sp.]
MSGVIRQVVIRGRVQGVGYRAWVDHEARRLGLNGWVRNRRDGSVEAVFEGETEVVAAMIASCGKGPGAARVDHVIEETANDDALRLRHPSEAFSVLPTI